MSAVWFLYVSGKYLHLDSQPVYTTFDLSGVINLITYSHLFCTRLYTFLHTHNCIECSICTYWSANSCRTNIRGRVLIHCWCLPSKIHTNDHFLFITSGKISNLLLSTCKLKCTNLKLYYFSSGVIESFSEKKC